AGSRPGLQIPRRRACGCLCRSQTHLVALRLAVGPGTSWLAEPWPPGPRPSCRACRRTPTALAPRQESAAGDAGPCRGRPGADGRRQVVGGAGPRARAPPVPPLLGRARDGGFCLPGSVVALIAGFLDRDFAAAARRPALAAA
ncbi:unnamed protein product, partial [Prorocentrum cordatum]